MSAYRFELHLGALCDDIESQLNRQGLTLGARAKRVQRWANEISSLSIHGLLTRTESDKARKRLLKEIESELQPLPQGADQ